LESVANAEKMLRAADVVMDVQNHAFTRGEKQQLILNRKEFTDTSLSVL
jgi:hypothetical protein